MHLVLRFALGGIFAAFLLLVAAPAQPQPVNAPPGTICVTPKGWCQAVRPGPPGTPCACRTREGWVPGKLR